MSDFPFPMLAQTSAPAATQAAVKKTVVVTDGDTTISTKSESPYHVAWAKWATFYDWTIGTRAISVLIVIWLIGVLLMRLGRKVLERYSLKRSTRIALFACTAYAFIIAAHPVLMIDPYDVLALIFHKAFAAVITVVAIRYIDRLVILPLLTRLSGGPPSRFIHQIIVTVVSIFAIATYFFLAFDLNVTSLAVSASALSIVVGLALQESLGNFFSGMVLQTSVPFQPGDWIQIGDVEGRVEEMTWRAVTIWTGANNHVLIPNGTVAKETIINFHAPTTRMVCAVAVGLDYEVPPHVAKAVLVQAAKDTPGVLSDPPPVAVLVDFGASSLNYKIAFSIDKPQSHGGVENDVRANAWYRLKQAKINIPYNIMVVEMSDTAKRQLDVDSHANKSRRQAIETTPLFKDLPQEAKDELISGADDFHLSTGQYLFREGENGDSMFMILEGTAEIFIRLDDGSERSAGELQPGSMCGQVSALTGHPRGSTVRAKEPVHVVVIRHAQLQALFAKAPQLMDRMSAVVAEEERQREEVYKKLGADRKKGELHTQSHNVLEKMKSLFNRRLL